MSLITILVVFYLLPVFVPSETAKWTEDNEPFAIKFNAIVDSSKHPNKWVMDCFTTRNATKKSIPGFPGQELWIPCTGNQGALARMEMLQLMHSQTQGIPPIQIAISSQLIVITNTDIIHTTRNFVRYAVDENPFCGSITLPDFDVTNSSWSDLKLEKQPWEETPEHPEYLRMMLTNPTIRQSILIHPATEINPIINYSHQIKLQWKCGRDSKNDWDVSEIKTSAKIIPIPDIPEQEVTARVIAESIFILAVDELRGCEFIWDKTKHSKAPISAKRLEFFREHLRDRLVEMDFARPSICVRNIKELNQDGYKKQIDFMKDYHKCTQCKKNPDADNNCPQKHEEF